MKPIARAFQIAKDDAEMKEKEMTMADEEPKDEDWIKAELPKDDTKDDEAPMPGA